MVNREYIKSQIDVLPEETVLVIYEFIKSGRVARLKPHKSELFTKPKKLYGDFEARIDEAIFEAEEEFKKGDYRLYDSTKAMFEDILSEEDDEI